MTRNKIASASLVALAALALLALAACGGGGGSGPQTMTEPSPGPQPAPEPAPEQEPPRAEPPMPEPEPAPEPMPPPTPPTLEGFRQWEFNVYAFDPQTDLPSSGTGGMQVSRPQGARVTINLEYAAGIADRLEGPNWYNNLDAQARLNLAADFIETAVWTGYKQWGRHLAGSYTVDVLVGERGVAESCGHSAVACYIPALNKVVLGEQWLLDNYRALHVGRALGIEGIEVAVFSELVFVATHEAAHQFGYEHPRGDTAGCGGDAKCHGPIGSGSVTSYDTLRGGTSRYAPDRDDVQHLVGGTWNPNAVDQYKVSRSPSMPAILEFGYWLDHEFAVSGTTAPGEPRGGTFSLLNAITVQPFVTGTPSVAHELRGDASWSGDFLGYHLQATRMTAVTADVALDYVFDTERMDLAVYDFQSWLGDSAVSIGGRYEYELMCTSAGCSYEEEGTPCLDGTAICGSVSVQTRFYPDEGDPSAYTGGVVNDDVEEYAGAFVATKD